MDTNGTMITQNDRVLILFVEYIFPLLRVNLKPDNSQATFQQKAYI